jgi:hypothetical protein
MPRIASSHVVDRLELQGAKRRKGAEQTRTPEGPARISLETMLTQTLKQETEGECSSEIGEQY